MCKSAPYIFTDGIYYTYGKQKVYSNHYSVKLPFNTLINNVGTYPGASLHLTESQLDSFALVTQGCFRIADEDIVELRQITDTLENTDPDEYKGYITVKDDLDIPVHYRDRDNIKYDWVRQGGVLPELIVTPMGCETILDFDQGSNIRNLYNK